VETKRFRLTIKEPMGAPPPVPGEPDIVHGLTIVIRHDEILVGASTDDRAIWRTISRLAYALLETPHTLAAVSVDRRAIQTLR